jgi:hypothetical protein
MNIDKAITELRVELAALDIAIAVLDERLGRVSRRRKPSSVATGRKMALVQRKRGAAGRQPVDPDRRRANRTSDAHGSKKAPSAYSGKVAQ